MAVDAVARAIAAGKVPVDAYEMAVAGGYTGTKEQFEEDMGNSGTNATNAADSAAAAAASATTAANAAGNLAPAYSASATYAVGDHVLYDGGYYVCNTAITTAEAWTAAHWTAVKVGPEITDLKNAIYSETIEGVTAYIYDAAEGPVKALTIAEGATKFFRTGKNLSGGDAWLNTGYGTVDLINRTVSGGSSSSSLPLIGAVIPKEFKEKTSYTFIITALTTNSNGGTALSIEYTDGTTTSITGLTPNVKSTIRVVTDSNKTLSTIRRGSTSGNKTFYVDECGLFEGDIAIADFVPYNGTIYSVENGVISETVKLKNGFNSLFAYPTTQFSFAYPLKVSDIADEVNTVKETTAQMQIKVDSSEDILAYGLSNVYTSENFVNGYWSAKSISSNSYIICIKQLIPVHIGDIIRIHSNPDNLVFAIGVYISSTTTAQHPTGWVEANEYEYVVQDNGSLWIQFCNALVSADRTEISASDMTAIFGFANKGYVARGIQNIGSLIDSSSKTIAFLGDSITAGVGTDYAYHMYLGDRFGWTCKNYGYGGSGYARSYPDTGGKMATGQTGIGVTITNSNKIADNDFAHRIASIDPNIDALVIFGGTNDWAHPEAVSISDFETAIETTFSYAQTNFTGIPIIVLGPMHRGNEGPTDTQSKTLSEYSDIIRTKAIKYGLKFIDLMNGSQMNPQNSANAAYYFTRDDTHELDSGLLHPNHLGHKVISNMVAFDIISYLYN